MSELFSFLGVEPTFRPNALTTRDASVRKGVSPKSPILDKLHAKLYDQLNRYAYMPLKRFIGIRQAAILKEVLQVRQTLQAIFYKQGYPKMKPKTSASLRSHFASEIQELAVFTGRDLSHWL